MHINGLDFDNPATPESKFKGFPLLNRKINKLYNGLWRKNLILKWFIQTQHLFNFKRSHLSMVVHIPYML